MAAGTLAAGTGETLALTDGGGAILRGSGDQNADSGALARLNSGNVAEAWPI